MNVQSMYGLFWSMEIFKKKIFYLVCAESKKCVTCCIVDIKNKNINIYRARRFEKL